MSNTQDSPLRALPPSKTIRDRLARLLREISALRRLLRVVEHAEKCAPGSGPEVFDAQ